MRVDALVEQHEREGRTSQPEIRRMLGDAHLLVRRFEAAASWYEDERDLQRLLQIGLGWGRYRLVRSLRERLALPDEAWRRFLRERALLAIPMGGDAERGFYIDQEVARAIADDLGEPLAPLLAEAAGQLLAQGSVNVAKCYIYARLSGDPARIRQAEPPWRQRAEQPRRQLPERIAERVAREGGQLLGELQRGDEDDYDPKSAWLWEARLGGARIVLKEHLRLPLDWAQLPGTSDEAGALASLDHPCVVRLREVWTLGRHEILVLDHIGGEVLSERARPGRLLPRPVTRSVGAALARVLSEMHAARSLYLDLKPANVLLRADAPVLVDFGMARSLAAAESHVTSLLSTPRYVPPEMARTLRASAASDVFQLGLFLFELWTGEPAFSPAPGVPEDEPGEEDREGQLVRYTLAHLYGQPRLERLDHPALRALLSQALDPTPQERPVAAHLASRLEELSP